MPFIFSDLAMWSQRGRAKLSKRSAAWGALVSLCRVLVSYEVADWSNVLL
jgi:hypothetical protein